MSHNQRNTVIFISLLQAFEEQEHSRLMTGSIGGAVALPQGMPSL